MEWVEYEDGLKKTYFHYIRNGSEKNIVLFGSCHLSTMAYMLNEITSKRFNFCIITSWYFKHRGYEYFDMNTVNSRIRELVKKSDIFIYMKHSIDYGIDADKIETYVGQKTKVIKIPNLRLVFNTDSREEYLRSLDMLKKSIKESDFPGFCYIVDQHRNHLFFNINEHPTHYILYLLSRSIVKKICHSLPKEGMEEYLSWKNRRRFLELNRKYVILPGRDVITPKISEITGISCEAEYFD